MKKALLAVTLTVLSGSAFAHNWFAEGVRITTYIGAAAANVTQFSNDRSFDNEAACLQYIADQNALNSFRDGNGRSMTSTVQADCHQAPIVMRVIVPAPK
mgnify:CR=1 FL=1